MLAPDFKPSLLLVEDSPDDAFFFERALRKTGLPAALRHFSDGADLIQHLSASPRKASDRRPDLIFLDLKMPITTGFDVLRWMQRQNFQPPLRVVVLSGSNQESDNRQARELGAVDYWVKPVATETLKQCLPELLSARSTFANTAAAPVTP